MHFEDWLSSQVQNLSEVHQRPLVSQYPHDSILESSNLGQRRKRDIASMEGDGESQALANDFVPVMKVVSDGV